MAFKKSDIRNLIKEHTEVESVPSALINAICEMHTTTQEEVVEEALEKVKVEDSAEYKELQAELEEVKGKQGKNVEVEDSAEYKELLEKVKLLETKESAAKLETAKKTALEELGIKGAALKALLKDPDLVLEFDDKGELKADSKKMFTEKVKEEYADMITKTETKGTGVGNGNQNPNQGTKIGRSEIAKMTSEEINKAWNEGRIDTTKE